VEIISKPYLSLSKRYYLKNTQTTIGL